LRTGNIDASSRTANGGNVTIQASDAIVGSINTSGSTDIVHRRRSDFYGNLVDYSYSFNGGDVSIKTDTFKAGTISTDGGTKNGKVTINASPFVPIPDSGNDTGSGSGQAGSGSTQTKTADGASGSSFNAAGASSGDTSGITISHSDNALSDRGTLTGTSGQINFTNLPANLFISDSISSFPNQNNFGTVTLGTDSLPQANSGGIIDLQDLPSLARPQDTERVL
jgi:hypothetical protein